MKEIESLDRIRERVARGSLNVLAVAGAFAVVLSYLEQDPVLPLHLLIWLLILAVRSNSKFRRIARCTVSV